MCNFGCPPPPGPQSRCPGKLFLPLSLSASVLSPDLDWGPRIRPIEETEAALFGTKGILSVVYLLLLERPSFEQRRLRERRV